MSDQPELISVPTLMTPRDFARLAKVHVETARAMFRAYPTVRVGRRRRMTYTTFKKHFLDKEA